METVYVTITVKVRGELDEHEAPPYEGEVAELRLPLMMLDGCSIDLTETFSMLVKAAKDRFAPPGR